MLTLRNERAEMRQQWSRDLAARPQRIGLISDWDKNKKE